MSGAILDIGFALLAAFLAFRGCWRGLSGEVISLAGTVGGCLIAWTFGPALAAVLTNSLGMSTGLAIVLALVVLFLAVMVAAALLGRLVQAFLRFTHLTLLDRILGVGAGLAKTGLVLMLFYGAVLLFSPIMPMEWVEESRVMDLASRGWPAVERILENTGLWPSPDVLPTLPGGRTSSEAYSL